jgi:dsDNA-specific endonuclease/ATPase MutS2
MSVQTKLDLRGLMVDECLLELDRFIDSSLRSGFKRIYHRSREGYGSTALSCPEIS